jgi:hypothetical protein
MYGTVADWIAYAALRGLTVADDDASAQALVRASDYIRTRYVIRFMAEYDGTAPQVIEATQIAAAYELETPGFWSKTFTASQVKVLTGVGNIKWTVTDTGMKGIDAQLPTSPAIDALLVPLTRWGMPAVFVA